MELAENNPYLALAEACIIDNLPYFRLLVSNGRYNIDQDILWSVCPIGENCNVRQKLRRTPLMIAAMYRSPNVVRYILQSGLVDVNRPSLSDGATAIECAYDAKSSPEIIEMLLDAQRNEPNNVDRNGWVSNSAKFAMFDYKVEVCERGCKREDVERSSMCRHWHSHEMYERRRDLRKQFYRATPCMEYIIGHPNSCQRGDECQFAHGKLENWYHPSQFRTTQTCIEGSECQLLFCQHAHYEVERRNPGSYASSLRVEKRTIFFRYYNMTEVGPPLTSLVARPPHRAIIRANPYADASSYRNESVNVPRAPYSQRHLHSTMDAPLMQQSRPGTVAFIDNRLSAYYQMRERMYQRPEPGTLMDTSIPVSRNYYGHGGGSAVDARSSSSSSNQQVLFNRVQMLQGGQEPNMMTSSAATTDYYRYTGGVASGEGPSSSNHQVYLKIRQRMQQQQEANMMMNLSTPGSGIVNYYENTQSQGNAAAAAYDWPSDPMEELQLWFANMWNPTPDDSKSGAN